MISKPSRLMLLIVALFALTWALPPILFNHTIEPDNLEQIIWASSLEMGYYKHPPVTTWITHFFTTVFGKSAQSMFLLGMLSVAVTLWFVWKLAEQLFTRPIAALATLLVCPITYFTSRGLMFNHNTAQMIFVAASCWAFWHAIQKLQKRYWIGFGAICALGMLTKYSMAIHILTFGAYLVYSKKILNSKVLVGLAIAGSVFVLILIPHVLWLMSHPANPISYARELILPAVVPDRISNVTRFLRGQFARLFPMIFAVILIKIYGKKMLGFFFTKKENTYWVLLSKDVREFVLILALFPLVAVSLAALVFNIYLEPPWASAFFTLFGFLMMRFIPRFTGIDQLKHVVLGLLLFQMLVSLGYGYARGPLAVQVGKDARSIFPSEKLAFELEKIWLKNEKSRLSIVVGDVWAAGSTALYWPQPIKPLVLLDGRAEYSPWLSKERIRECPTLIVVDPSDKDSLANLAFLANANVSGSFRLAWTDLKNSPITEIRWAIRAGDNPLSKNC
jgi:4-amino-4-deoxy-L-arabinose transferase-like glycosyltransferase